MSDLNEITDLLEGKATKLEQELVKKAYEFAKRAHEGQKRISGDPYFVHVFETAKILAKLGMDAETISAGLMHDVLEDTITTEEEMRKEFGDDIVFLVNGVTKLGTLKYRGDERHAESLRKFFIAMTNDLRVVIIKFADRLHNLHTLQYLRDEKQKRIALESIEIYAPLANRFGMGKLKGEMEDAAFPFAYPKEYAQVEKIIREKKDLFEKNFSAVQKELEKEFDKNKIKVIEINYQIKQKYRLWKRLTKCDMDIERVYDAVALRVIVENIEECYKVLGLVHSIWKPLSGKTEDYIAVPKPNGYRSIHTTIFTGSGGIAEIQIRTKEMHAVAAYGIVTHFSNKGKSAKKKYDDKSKFKWTEEIKDFIYELDEPKKYLEHLKTDYLNDRIFIFTPKGDVIDLPEDSSPIDFAYSIHSDTGNHVSRSKVNDKIVPIFSKLKNGDIVEIITRTDSHPSSKWLKYSKTNIAKKNIRSYLEKNSLLFRLKSIARSLFQHFSTYPFFKDL